VQTISVTATVSGGTFTITVVETGETTAPIPFGSTAAAIQTALEALATVDPGDILCSGGPLPATPVVMTYSGQFAGRDVVLATISSALLTGGGSYNAVATTPGADTVVDVPAVPAGAVFGNVYLDSSFAGIGVTQLLYCYEMELSIGERMGRIRPINKSKSSDAVVDIADQEHTLALTLGRNAVADAQLAKLRAGTRVFPRVEWEGDTISGANKYLFQVDSCLIYSEVGMPDNVQDASTREFTGMIAIDAIMRDQREGPQRKTREYPRLALSERSRRAVIWQPDRAAGCHPAHQPQLRRRRPAGDRLLCQPPDRGVGPAGSERAQRGDE
jgi:hypothetical protein